MTQLTRTAEFHQLVEWAAQAGWAHVAAVGAGLPIDRMAALYATAHERTGDSWSARRIVEQALAQADDAITAMRRVLSTNRSLAGITGKLARLNLSTGQQAAPSAETWRRISVHGWRVGPETGLRWNHLPGLIGAIVGVEKSGPDTLVYVQTHDPRAVEHLLYRSAACSPGVRGRGQLSGADLPLGLAVVDELSLLQVGTGALTSATAVAVDTVPAAAQRQWQKITGAAA